MSAALKKWLDAFVDVYQRIHEAGGAEPPGSAEFRWVLGQAMWASAVAEGRDTPVWLDWACDDDSHLSEFIIDTAARYLRECSAPWSETEAPS